MSDDELAERRRTADASATQAKPPARARKPRRKPPAQAIPFWKWMGSQHHHTDPVCRAAAEHIRDRWGFSEFYNHARVIRALTSEESEHAVGARRLADEYAGLFGISDDDRQAVSGVRKAWFPFGPELCEHCSREAIPGTGVCARHGGQWITEEDRVAASRAVTERMEMLSSRAVRVVEDLLDHGRSEKVRLEAALAVLDRVGMGAASTLHIDTGDGPDPADLIRARLDRLSSAIVDGEIVIEPGDEPDADGTLAIEG